mgnify:CR=1 FL=1
MIGAACGCGCGATGSGNFVSLFVGIYFIDLTLLGAWSALYFAINFFLQIEEQADRLERLEAQATSAQLAMLRYQLNPHFLFNTLNAISTLILDQDTKLANDMVMRLSRFLRYSLDNDPMQRVTVAEEVDALIDGRPIILSCVRPAQSVQGCSITTSSSKATRAISAAMRSIVSAGIPVW